MEADWSVELAAEDPVIVVPWAADDGSCKFVDLRRRLEPPAGKDASRNLQAEGENQAPYQVPDEISGEIFAGVAEATHEPALGSALLELNGARSPLWTAKCDAWLTDSTESGDQAADLLEMDCAPGSSPAEGRFLAGFYIDILLRDGKANESFAVQERWVRAVVRRLKNEGPPCARTEFVLRHAETWGVPGFGVTWFVEACGPTRGQAEQRRAEALQAALPLVIAEHRR
jgi:hypothetical protein